MLCIREMVCHIALSSEALYNLPFIHPFSHTLAESYHASPWPSHGVQCLAQRHMSLKSELNQHPKEFLALVRKCVWMCVGVFVHEAQRAALVPAGVQLNVTA